MRPCGGWHPIARFRRMLHLWASMPRVVWGETHQACDATVTVTVEEVSAPPVVIDMIFCSCGRWFHGTEPTFSDKVNE